MLLGILELLATFGAKLLSKCELLTVGTLGLSVVSSGCVFFLGSVIATLPTTSTKTCAVRGTTSGAIPESGVYVRTSRFLLTIFTDHIVDHSVCSVVFGAVVFISGVIHPVFVC